jgi:hypothetical protein
MSSEQKNITTILTDLADAGHDGSDRPRAERHAQIEAQVQPLLAEAHALLGEHGALKARHLDRIQDVANTPWADTLRATPQNLTMVNGRATSPTHKALNRLRAAAENALPLLRSGFGDVSMGARDLDPVNLQGIVEAMSNLLASGNVYDAASGAPSQWFRRTRSHLDWHLDRARKLVGSTVEAVKRFDEAVAHVQETLDGIEPRAHEDIPPAPERLKLPPLATPPSHVQESSYQDFTLPAFKE